MTTSDSMTTAVSDVILNLPLQRLPAVAYKHILTRCKALDRENDVASDYRDFASCAGLSYEGLRLLSGSPTEGIIEKWCLTGQCNVKTVLAALEERDRLDIHQSIETYINSDGFATLCACFMDSTVKEGVEHSCESKEETFGEDFNSSSYTKRVRSNRNRETTSNTGGMALKAVPTSSVRSNSSPWRETTNHAPASERRRTAPLESFAGDGTNGQEPPDAMTENNRTHPAKSGDWYPPCEDRHTPGRRSNRGHGSESGDYHTERPSKWDEIGKLLHSIHANFTGEDDDTCLDRLVVYIGLFCISLVGILRSFYGLLYSPYLGPIDWSQWSVTFYFLTAAKRVLFFVASAMAFLDFWNREPNTWLSLLLMTLAAFGLLESKIVSPTVAHLRQQWRIYGQRVVSLLLKDQNTGEKSRLRELQCTIKSQLEVFLIGEFFLLQFILYKVCQIGQTVLSYFQCVTLLICLVDYLAILCVYMSHYRRKDVTLLRGRFLVDNVED